MFITIDTTGFIQAAVFVLSAQASIKTEGPEKFVVSMASGIAGLRLVVKTSNTSHRCSTQLSTSRSRLFYVPEIGLAPEQSSKTDHISHLPDIPVP